MRDVEQAAVELREVEAVRDERDITVELMNIPD